jgi:periplasmic protein TonB
MADPELAQMAGQPPLSDIRTLATGFQELSAKAIPPPPLAVAPAPVVPTVAPVPTAVPSAVAPAVARIYTASDTKVLMPAAIKQDLPPFSGRVSETSVGALEIIINERGQVESATIRESVSPAYDRLAVDAARSWRFKPAMLDGVPVKFRKLISITVKP